MLNEKNGFNYSISYVDYPNELFEKKTINQVLDNARYGSVTNVGGRLLKEIQVSIKNYPGREITIGVADGKAIVQVRLFLVNHRLYQLTAGASKKESLSNNIKKFLDSFDILMSK